MSLYPLSQNYTETRLFGESAVTKPNVLMSLKERKGFTTRTQIIIYLIQYALEQSENRDGK